MTQRERYAAVVDYFEQAMPEVRTELHYDDTFQLLVAVMLSAQCTDKRVNLVTPALFEAFPTVAAMAAATVDDILPYVASVSYPNSKALHIVEAARMLMDEYDGIIPQTMEELVKLPGVGRKTANVVLSVAFGQATMAVDTHVFRVSHRLGLVSSKATTPLAVERQLVKHLSDDIIPRAHHWLILHGRYVCKALRPKCVECGLQRVCLHYSRENN